MFDIREYFSDYRETREVRDFSTEIGVIEEDIAADIESLLKSRFERLYLQDRFRYPRGGVDIICPRIPYPGGGRALLKSPDHLRFLLSLYPRRSDLENVEKIVLRPRHIEIANIELMSLYIRQKKILVLYLHYPHLYQVHESKFREYSELIPTDLARWGSIPPVQGDEAGIKIPPLWYVLSLIAHSQDDRIDKFFVRVRREERDERKILENLDEISFFYSRHGY